MRQSCRYFYVNLCIFLKISEAVIPRYKMDAYNFFQDCYKNNVDSFRRQIELTGKAKQNPAVSFN
jgi:hypothetical protein